MIVPEALAEWRASTEVRCAERRQVILDRIREAGRAMVGIGIRQLYRDVADVEGRSLALAQSGLADRVFQRVRTADAATWPIVAANGGPYHGTN